jgi:outer membrane receptor protein involved in Fe transport
MQSKKGIAALVYALALLVVPNLILAAPAATEIHGTAKDTLGRPLSGVNLTLQTSEGKKAGETTSDAGGHFVFSHVAPGAYAVMGKKTGFEESTAIVTVEAGSAATTALTLNAKAALEVQVQVERLAEARNNLSVKTGSSEYQIDQAAISALPEGANTPFNDVLLQAPGVANDSFGQLHIRGEHANIQYRIDGVVIPEAITGFGQSFDTRSIQQIDLLTGALPAEYGYRTSGVVEIQTKTTFQNGGQVEMYGGSHSTSQPSVEYGGSDGKLNYFGTFSYLGDNLGIENPTSSTNAIHDHTDQFRGFGYLSYLLSPTTKISLIAGSYDGWFQIPNNPGQVPNAANYTNPGPFTTSQYLNAAGITGFNSASLKENQYETNRFQILALQSSIGSDYDYQVSWFARETSVHFKPDPIGDLAFNGVAADVLETGIASGVQYDSTYRLNDCHTVRAGLFASDENIVNDNNSLVFTTDTATPTEKLIRDNEPKNGNVLYGIYIQDEWKALPKLTINYGVRFDQMDSFVETNQWSPRLGAVYKLTSDTTLHAGYARYFTPPPFETIPQKTLSLFENTTNAATINENSPVSPERAHYFDAGVIQNITPSFKVGIDAFYKITTDVLDEGQFGQALIFAPFNYAQGRIKGIELTTNYQIAGNLTAYGNVAVTQSLAKDVVSGQFQWAPDELAYADTHWIHTDHDQFITSSGGLSYKLWGTTYTVDGTYGSGLRSGFANTSSVPANIQFNLGALREFDLPCLGRWKVRAAIINLFDTKNEIRAGTGIGVFAPQWGPRFGLFGGLAKLF